MGTNVGVGTTVEVTVGGGGIRVGTAVPVGERCGGWQWPAAGDEGNDQNQCESEE